MRRRLFVLLMVAVVWGVAGACGHCSTLESSGVNWVRTVDGWQRRRVVEARRPAEPPTLHPATVAAFQLAASLLVLAAFPTRVRAERLSRVCAGRLHVRNSPGATIATAM